MATKRRAKTVKRGPEGTIQDSIRDLLKLKYKWRAWRTNVHEGPTLWGGYIKCGEPGHADLTCLVPAGDKKFYVLHIECKTPKEKQRFEQKIWMQGVQGNGEFYMLARSQDDVEAFLREQGWIK